MARKTSSRNLRQLVTMYLQSGDRDREVLVLSSLSPYLVQECGIALPTFKLIPFLLLEPFQKNSARHTQRCFLGNFKANEVNKGN